METCSERRKRKLIALAEEKGGTKTIATDCGLNPQTLDQIVKGVLLPKKDDGTRNERSLGDEAARKIEVRYGLERGWFDSEEVTGIMSEREMIEVSLDVITKALMKTDDFTMGWVRHSLSRLGLDSSETVNISRKIADLLVTKHGDSPPVHDSPSAAEVGVLIGSSASKDLGEHDGRSDRNAGKKSAKK